MTAVGVAAWMVMLSVELAFAQPETRTILTSRPRVLAAEQILSAGDPSPQAASNTHADQDPLVTKWKLNEIRQSGSMSDWEAEVLKNVLLLSGAVVVCFILFKLAYPS